MSKREVKSKWIYIDNKGKEVEPNEMKEGKVYKLIERRR